MAVVVQEREHVHQGGIVQKTIELYGSLLTWDREGGDCGDLPSWKGNSEVLIVVELKWCTKDGKTDCGHKSRRNP